MKKVTCLLLLTASCLVMSHRMYGQEKFIIHTGLGLPSGLNMGIRQQINQTQIGLSAGIPPFRTDRKDVIINFSVYQHFGGTAELSKRRPWYARAAFHYLRSEGEFKIDKLAYLSARVGREFNITESLGAEVDLGPMFLVLEEEIIKKSSSSWDLNFVFPVLPSFGIGLFYKF